jgi:hypothetical protein
MCTASGGDSNCCVVRFVVLFILFAPGIKYWKPQAAYVPLCCECLYVCPETLTHF